jgi:hypothetical protein
MQDHSDSTSLARGLTLPLCFIAALLEGAAMQNANAAMPRLVPALGIAGPFATWVLSASVVASCSARWRAAGSAITWAGNARW